MQITADSLWSDLAAIRERKPLVHNITNYVVMNNTANALLALDASPVMAHAADEVEDMVSIAGALVINIGTLDSTWEPAMHRAAARARGIGVPIVLDPVGAGATPYRTDAVARLLDTATPSVIRGNASEIRAVLAAGVGNTKGVDSSDTTEEAAPDAVALSKALGCVVCMSGEVDYIIDGDGGVLVRNGHAMMPRVTGLGCTASALCGAFLAVESSPPTAAAHAMLVMGIAGEVAAERAAGPGSLQLHFLDALANLDRDDIARRMRVEVRR
ncbi:MAG: hydroxyethylthiazole kinase [Spirochaetales bacterium]|nr:hydroxyethylthiazole kinase [Spirochaetales bacterium]